MDYQDLLEYYSQLDRSKFLDGDLTEYAAIDTPLPIGYGQTISQPSLVLEMTHLLLPERDNRVLEIGTGSGYQTALLARFSKEVYTVERIKELSERAKKRLDGLGLNNIYYKVGDGSEGWAYYAPYDRIIVTAAAGSLPDDLLDQLADGGRMIVPVGPKGLQELKIINKEKNGMLKTEDGGRVVFVEMKGKYGW